MPLYDADTRLLFLAGKGSTVLMLCEMQADKKMPLITPGK